MGKLPLELKPKDLKPYCDPKQFTFKTTADLSPWDEVIGQERAVEALKFGLGIKKDGYNIFATGITGTGKSTLIRSMLDDISSRESIPDDYCYVFNFKNPDNPVAITLKAGMGCQFQNDMDGFISYLKDSLPKVFEGKEYTDEKNRLFDDTNKSKETLFEELIAKGREHGFKIVSDKKGITFTPLYKGEPIDRKKMEELDPGELRLIEDREKTIHAEVRDFFAKTRILDKEAEEKVDNLNKSVVESSTEGKFTELKEKYKEYPRIIEHLNETHNDLLEHFKGFLPAEGPVFAMPLLEGMEKERSFIKYKVNLLVDNGDSKGAPVLEESHPTYTNLVGTIEKKSYLGALHTDFTMIKAGSILQANGGYLMLNVLDVLRSPFSWDALKRVLKKKELTVEDIGDLYGIGATSVMKPEPIPIDLKIVLIGSSWIYSLLQIYEEDFSKIFKVKADFDYRVSNTPEGVMDYANFISKVCKEKELLPFDRESVASVVEQSSRLVDHKKKLSLKFSEITDIVHESSYWASERGKKVVGKEDVEKAIEKKIFRSNLIEEHIQEAIDEGTLLVDVEGGKEGQVNGLAVYAVGDYSFGRPSRITARTFLGRKGVVNIEREAKLSGKTHSKGVLILGGYFSGHYAKDHPLSLSASLGFEQTYGMIDGDSASAAELIAILSSLTGIPIKQGIAITGSINQHGDIQPIGGVNEKVEGFFAVCSSKGLNGEQGVIIPQQNVKNLVLKKEVVKAVAEGKFHVYSVKHIDEAIELLTGMPAGKIGKDGTFPKGTLNYLVQKEIIAMDKKLRKSEGSKGK